MDKSVSVRFYRVRRRDREGVSFSDCLRELGGRNLADREVEIDDGVTVRLDQFGEHAGYINGLFLRKQIHNLPPKVPPGAPAIPLGLPQGYALGHSIAFRYHPGLSVLALQYNQKEVSLLKIHDYISIALGTPGYRFEPVLNLDAWRQLNSTVPRKLTIKVAAPDQLEAVENNHLTTKTSLENLKNLSGGAHVELSFSMGHHQGSLLPRSIRNLSSWIMGESEASRGEISKIRLEGKNEDGATIALDLLNAQLGEKTTLDLPDDPERSYQIRDQYVSDVCRRNWLAVREQFGAAN